MAKMHSRARARAGSRRPAKRTKPSWMRYKPKEIEMLVTKLAKEGKSSSLIGLVLRDSYGVPDVKAATGKKIVGLLADKGIAPKIPEDLLSLMKRSVQIRKHLEKNRQDMAALRGLQFTESKIKRLVKYYKKIAKLPVDWKYDADSIKLLTE